MSTRASYYWIGLESDFESAVEVFVRRQGRGDASVAAQVRETITEFLYSPEVGELHLRRKGLEVTPGDHS